VKKLLHTLLIVDDEQLNLKLLKAFFKKTGYLIMEAKNGPEALEQAEAGPDLILLDIMMPGMDGFETCRKLKGRDETKDIPIIFLSSIEDAEIKVRCLEMGGVDYISKPFEAREVQARVKTHITLKEQELHLREYADKLEKMVDERTRELIHADRLATLGTFSAGIAHEIRNPLTGINTYLYNLEELAGSEDCLNSQDMEMLQQILRQIQIASDKIESVIKRVLDFSKPIMPKMRLININDYVEEAVKLASVTLRRKGINLERQLKKDIPCSYADSMLMEQAIINLINNAARALKGENGDKTILLTSSCNDTHIYIRVSDSGHGVPQHLREKVFDPFFTTNTDGSGLGLSIVHRIVQYHGGSVCVTTGSLGGAEFIIELPMEKRRAAR